MRAKVRTALAIGQAAPSGGGIAAAVRPLYRRALPPHAASPPLRVNRAPVLTLWAAVVAGRLGHPPDVALTLGRAVAGASAQAKARRLGIADDDKGEERAAGERSTKAATAPIVRLLGRGIAVADSGAALDKGKPASATGVRTYLTRAFGDRLGGVRAAMEALAASLPPDELTRVGFRLYGRFRPEVPEGVVGWGAKAVLDIGRIERAAE